MIALILGMPGANGWEVKDIQVARPVGRPQLTLVGGTDVAKREIDQQVKEIQERRTAVEPGQTAFTVAQFCAMRGINIAMRDMQRIGKAAAKFSREQGLAISRVADELFGEVNAYCGLALEAVAGSLTGGKEVAA